MNLFVTNLIAPEPPYKCEIAYFPVAMTPYMLAALEYRIAKYIWEPESRYTAEQLLREVQMALLTGCLQELINSNNRIYMLLDQTLNGQQYEAVSTDPLVIVPPIPVVPRPNFDSGGVIRQIADMRALIDNSLNGTVNATYGDPRGVKQRLDEIRDAIGEGGFSAEEKLQLLGDIAKIAALLL